MHTSKHEPLRFCEFFSIFYRSGVIEFEKNRLRNKSCRNWFSTLTIGWEIPSVSKTCPTWVEEYAYQFVSTNKILWNFGHFRQVGVIEFYKNRLRNKLCRNWFSTLPVGWEVPSVSKTCPISMEEYAYQFVSTNQILLIFGYFRQLRGHRIWQKSTWKQIVPKLV